VSDNQFLHRRDLVSSCGYNGVTRMESNLRADSPHGPNGHFPLRVLVVEDDADTAASMAMLLQLYMHDVQLAKDGAAALRAVQEGQPDVVLLDIGLPKLDGWQLAKEIRGHSRDKRPFLIAISGYGSQSDQMRSQEAGIDLHLVKPVEPEVLQQILRRFQTVAMPNVEDCRA
jgi:DNA-binding response OmpR family regulator